jgi:hypothetical protein
MHFVPLLTIQQSMHRKLSELRFGWLLFCEFHIGLWVHTERTEDTEVFYFTQRTRRSFISHRGHGGLLCHTEDTEVFYFTQRTRRFFISHRGHGGFLFHTERKEDTEVFYFNVKKVTLCPLCSLCETIMKPATQ